MGRGPITVTGLPPLDRHSALSMVNSQTDPKASTTVLVGLAANSAAPLVLNVSKCQKSWPVGKAGSSFRASKQAGPASSVVAQLRVVACPQAGGANMLDKSRIEAINFARIMHSTAIG